jgi:hypothetical protein
VAGKLDREEEEEEGLADQEGWDWHFIPRAMGTMEGSERVVG